LRFSAVDRRGDCHHGLVQEEDVRRGHRRREIEHRLHDRQLKKL
jgi:hypothetical protein